MTQRKKKTSPKKAPVNNQQAGQEGSVNENKYWQAVRSRWAKEQRDKALAHLLNTFDTDDEAMPLSRHILFLTIVGFFIVMLIWMNLATVDEVTRGEGRVIPSSEIQALQSLEPGIVEEFLVREGDVVSAGQVLVRLSDIEASSDLGANQARYYGLLASIRRLQAEAEGKIAVEFPDEVLKAAPSAVTEELNAFRANKESLRSQTAIIQQQLSQRREEVRELETRINDIRAIIRLQEEEMAMVRPLVERGAAPRMELLQLERTARERGQELNSARANLPRARAAVQEVQARIQEIESSAKADAQTELAARQVELSEISERLNALQERKTRTEIKSPVNGTVKELTINTVGGVVRAGEDIIQIVPKDDQLLVEARIRPSDIAFLYPTQEAIVKLTAYDFSIYGGLKGEVVDISADTIEDEQDGQSYYRVRVSTFETELKRKGEVLPIIPGMVASVDILTGKKTIYQYLMKPFYKTLDRALTER